VSPLTVDTFVSGRMQAEVTSGALTRAWLSTKRTWLWIPCCHVKRWTVFFMLHCSSSVSYM